MHLRLRQLTEAEVEQAAYDGTNVLVIGPPVYNKDQKNQEVMMSSDWRYAVLEYKSDYDVFWESVGII